MLASKNAGEAPGVFLVIKKILLNLKLVFSCQNLKKRVFAFLEIPFFKSNEINSRG